MHGYATSAKHAYTEAAVMTAPPEKLVVMLYEGALRFLARASASMRAGQHVVANENVRRACAIVDELNVALDMSYGEVPDRLRGIYNFCNRYLLESSLRQEVDGIEAIARLLGELHAAWVEIAESAARESARPRAATA